MRSGGRPPCGRHQEHELVKDLYCSVKINAQRKEVVSVGLCVGVGFFEDDKVGSLLVVIGTKHEGFTVYANKVAQSIVRKFSCLDLHDERVLTLKAQESQSKEDSSRGEVRFVVDTCGGVCSS